MITELAQEEFIREMSKKINSRLEIGPVLIPGGSSFQDVYRSLKLTTIKIWPLLFTDDRLVDLTDKASNFGNLLRVNEKLCDNLYVSYFESLNKFTQEHLDSEITKILKSSETYSVFLGVGLDGHVASLFDQGVIVNLFEGNTISIIKRHIDKYNRITLNKDVIMKAAAIYVVVNGKGKEYLVSLIKSNKPVPSPLNEIIKLPKTEIFHVIH